MNLSPLPIQKFFDSNGIPLAGGQLFTYIAGTTTKIATCKDQAGTLNTNPIVLDYRGEANVWLDQTLTYKFTLAPAGDTDPPTRPIWTVDNISAAVTYASLTAQIIGQILYPRTAAEIAAGVTPTNYYVPSHEAIGKLNIRRYGGAPGAGDNTTAMNSAASVVAQLGGGILLLDAPGVWKMNWTGAAQGLKVEGASGKAPFDLACVRPFNIATGPAMTFGDGVTNYYDMGLINLHVSGTDGSVGADKQSAKSASSCLSLKGGCVSFIAIDCWFYNGLNTLSLIPSATNPVTGVRFIGGGARNDLTDSASARTIYMKSINNNGFATDNVWAHFKLNGPGDPAAATLGYLAEFDGTADGVFAEFDYCYADTKPDFASPSTVCHGVLLKGSAQIRCNGFTLDPNATGVPIIETDQVLGDVARYIVGELRQGGQRMKFAAGALVDIPVEAETFNYKARIHTPWFTGPRSLVVPGAATQYPTTVQWELQSATGPDRLTGSDLQPMKDVLVAGGNASTSAQITSASGSGGAYLGAVGTNQNVRLVPSGTGQVVCEGAYLRPSGDNTQDCGGASNRWKIVYAGTGAINTSDETVKDEISDIPPEWLAAWGDVQWQRFKFKDALATKGDGARWHIGLIAQRVRDAFEKHGLDATQLGLLCYDEWDDEYEDERETYFIESKNGEQIEQWRYTGNKVLVKKAGCLWAMRYEEALAMECAYLRSKVS